MTPLARAVPCHIAAKIVRGVLRRGVATEPALYVHCSEDSCQYVDRNEPPCPLTVQLFDDPANHLVGRYVAALTGRMCLECLSAVLDVTHDQVRRAIWRLDHGQVRVGAGLCARCKARRLTIALRSRSGAAHPPPRIAHGEAASPSDDEEELIRRLTALLHVFSGDAYCAACLAIAAGASLSATIETLATAASLKRYVVRGSACARCGRIQPLLAAAPPRTA